MAVPGFDKARQRIERATERALSKVEKVMGEPDDNLVFYESLTPEEMAAVQNRYPGQFPDYVRDLELQRLRQHGKE